MKENLLSIGEVSKLKGVSIKSLRYYDTIGVLKPHYVNEETSYRYYTQEQMLMLDIIVFCVDLDIPLKTFEEYRNEKGELDLERMLMQGQKIAKEKLRKTQETLDRMSYLACNMQVYKQHWKEQKCYERTVSERKVFTASWDGKLVDAKIRTKKITEIYNLCLELGITTLYQDGICYEWDEKGVKSYIFLDIIDKAIPHPSIKVLPATKCTCEVFSQHQLEQAQSKIEESIKSNTTGCIILNTVVYPTEVDGQCFAIELQEVQK